MSRVLSFFFSVVSIVCFHTNVFSQEVFDTPFPAPAPSCTCDSVQSAVANEVILSEVRLGQYISPAATNDVPYSSEPSDLNIKLTGQILELRSKLQKSRDQVEEGKVSLVKTEQLVGTYKEKSLQVERELEQQTVALQTIKQELADVAAQLEQANQQLQNVKAEAAKRLDETKKELAVAKKEIEETREVAAQSTKRHEEQKTLASKQRLIAEELRIESEKQIAAAKAATVEASKQRDQAIQDKNKAAKAAAVKAEKLEAELQQTKKKLADLTKKANDEEEVVEEDAVSYTHLTLPTTPYV